MIGSESFKVGNSFASIVGKDVIKVDIYDLLVIFKRYNLSYEKNFYHCTLVLYGFCIVCANSIHRKL